MKRNILKFAAAISLCLSAGFLGALATDSSVGSWYQTLEKPSFNPPSWLFGPVWTTLYILMGISLWLIWKKPGKYRAAITIFLIQLGLNALWSVFFFGLKSPLLGMIDIIPLFILILVTIWRFYQIEKWAGYLLIPYSFWVAFATILNASILHLNS